MKLKEWIAKEGRSLKWLGIQLGIPMSLLYSYSSGTRSLADKYVYPLIKLTNGEVTYEDIKGLKNPKESQEKT